MAEQQRVRDEYASALQSYEIAQKKWAEERKQIESQLAKVREDAARKIAAAESSKEAALREHKDKKKTKKDGKKADLEAAQTALDQEKRSAAAERTRLNSAFNKFQEAQRKTNEVAAADRKTKEDRANAIEQKEKEAFGR